MWCDRPWRFSFEDQIQSGIQGEKELSAELDAKLHEWEKKLRQKQAEIGGANAADTFNANVRKQERVFENRLDTVGRNSSIGGKTMLCLLKALKRFNALLATNGLLRAEIDNLRNERERYENLSRKSENELRDLRAQLMECIERSVISYEQR